MARQHSSSSSLFWLLAASVACNVAVGTYMFVQWRDGVLWLEVEAIEPSKAQGEFVHQSSSLSQYLLDLNTKRDDDLIEALKDEQIATNGYRIQELALALIRQRRFNVEDALRSHGGWPQSLSPFCYQDQDGVSRTIFLFSSLTPNQIHAVYQYFQEHPAPYTAAGLVDRLPIADDPALLKEALEHSDEWQLFRALLPAFSDDQAYALAKDIGGEVFLAMVEWGKSHPDDREVSRLFLYLFRRYPSQRLAEVLAEKYADIVIQSATDDTIMLIYTHLPVGNVFGAKLAIKILQGQRKPVVWQASQAYLAKASGAAELATMGREEVLALLRSPSKQTKPLPAPKKELSVASRVATRQLQPYRTHEVQKGESLWALSKRYHVGVDAIKQLNGLKNDALSPGMVLKIPH